VLDPPSLPDKPSFPKKPYFLGGGLTGGFALGLGILALIAFSDRSIYSERDVELCLQLPVLGLIPNLKVKASAAKSILQRENNSYLAINTGA
jgi:capsular polysaccharide biosynthesis protein